MEGESPNHVVARVREALAEDERTHILDVDVEFRGTCVAICGVVGSEVMKRAAEDVAREVLRENIPLVSELWIDLYNEPPEPETIR